METPEQRQAIVQSHDFTIFSNIYNYLWNTPGEYIFASAIVILLVQALAKSTYCGCLHTAHPQGYPHPSLEYDPQDRTNGSGVFLIPVE
jgi:hypothetical protein